jgi:hypothetical protein
MSLPEAYHSHPQIYNLVSIDGWGLSHVHRADHTSPSSTSRHVTPELYRLLADEEIWRDRYSFLFDRGLELRFRYQPEWTPSWLGTNLDPEDCEDSIEKTVSLRRPPAVLYLSSEFFQPYMVLDAKRLEDGAVVCIKRIRPKNTEGAKIPRTNEVKIGRYLSTEQMLHHPDNHCVPILDSFRDPIFPEVEYIVMPVLRRYNDPEFCFVGEVVDFVTQLLEVGILYCFIHPSHSIC